MVDYNDGQWHGWNGGECPVHPDTTVRVQLYWESRKDVDNECDDAVEACFFNWFNSKCDDDIIAFRVVKEYREPREVWLMQIRLNDYPEPSWHETVKGNPNATLFREVIE